MIRVISGRAVLPLMRLLFERFQSLGGVLLIALGLAGCSGESPTAPSTPALCGPFPPWESSEYVLPYPIGAAYEVNQGNCSGFGHSGFWKYGYDFTMAIGTPVTAARAGVVLHAQDGASDGDRARTNLVTIQHADGTVALYSHLTLGGVMVQAGQIVDQGDRIGSSGDTGNTGGLPHLHFSLHPCGGLPGLPGSGNCPSRAATFRNTDPNPEGLQARRSYTALSY